MTYTTDTGFSLVSGYINRRLDCVFRVKTLSEVFPLSWYHFKIKKSLNYTPPCCITNAYFDLN